MEADEEELGTIRVSQPAASFYHRPTVPAPLAAESDSTASQPSVSVSLEEIATGADDVPELPTEKCKKNIRLSESSWLMSNVLSVLSARPSEVLSYCLVNIRAISRPV